MRAAFSRSVAFGPSGEEPRPAVSLRALALFVVCLVAFAIIAPTLRYAVAQQEQLRAVTANVEEAEARTAELERRLELWQDPEYVQAQARDRLGYVMPGETAYVVVDPEVATGEQSAAEREAAEREAQHAAATPWYLRTWETMEIAGASATGEDDPAGLIPAEEE